jgi:hypothetical protein
VIPSATLEKLAHLRARQKDATWRHLNLVRAAHRDFERQRRGWRDRLAAETAVAEGDPLALARWVEASHARERATAERATQMRQVVAAAEAAHQAADLALEQVRTLQREARSAVRRAAQAEAQRRLDDFGSGPRRDGSDDRSDQPGATTSPGA